MSSYCIPSVASARLLDTLDTAATVWTDVKSQAPITQQNLIPLTKLWSEKTEEEIEAYQTAVKGQVGAWSTLEDVRWCDEERRAQGSAVKNVFVSCSGSRKNVGQCPRANGNINQQTEPTSEVERI